MGLREWGAVEIARARVTEMGWAFAEPIALVYRRGWLGQADRFEIEANAGKLGTKARFTMDAATGKSSPKATLPIEAGSIELTVNPVNPAKTRAR